MHQTAAAKALTPPQPRTTAATRLRQIPAKPLVLESRTVYYVFQRKYGLDPGAVWWRKLVFQVYLRIARFFYMKPFRIPMVDGRDADGREFYIEHQGVYLDEFMARQASDEPFWGFHELPLNDSLSTLTTIAIHHEMPGSPANSRYKRNSQSTIEVPRLDLVKLAGKIAQTDALVAQFHHSKTV